MTMQASLDSTGTATDNFRRVALPISAATFLSMVGVGMLVPALPEFAAQAGDAAVAAGALIGAYGVSRLLFNAPSGMLVDRVGILASAYIGLALLAVNSLVGYLLADYTALLVVMAVQGAASSLFSTAAMTALVVSAGPKSRGRAMAWFQTSLLLGFAIGPVIGGQLIDRFESHFPFLIQIGIALLAVVMVRTMPRGPAKQGAAPQGGPAPSAFGTLLVVGGISGFAAFFCRFGVAWNIVPVAALGQFQLSSSELGWIIGVGTLANVAVTPFLGRLIDGWGARRSFIASGILNVAGMLALFAAPSQPMLWFATATVLFATGIMIPSAAALALTGVRPQNIGRIMGLYRTMAESGMAVGPIAVPALTSVLGLATLSGLLACVAATSAAIAMVLVFGAVRQIQE